MSGGKINLPLVLPPRHKDTKRRKNSYLRGERTSVMSGEKIKLPLVPPSHKDIKRREN
jgi:hypothetical protein